MSRRQSVSRTLRQHSQCATYGENQECGSVWSQPAAGSSLLSMHKAGRMESRGQMGSWKVIAPGHEGVSFHFCQASQLFHPPLAGLEDFIVPCSDGATVNVHMFTGPCF